ncbi:MAG: YoaK family protein, partial [Acutalibacteraceae bacterium]|nr:YoaK family protein [Acutalibacteraceae bacterium]
MSESFLIGAMLSVVGGFWDAYTYIARGKVFANAQTGNIVLLGLNLARGEWHKAMLYAVPILAFVAGILIVELIRSRFQNISALHWRQIIIAAEIVIITAVAFIPYGNMNIVANVLVSFVCSLQV